MASTECASKPYHSYSINRGTEEVAYRSGNYYFALPSVVHDRGGATFEISVYFNWNDYPVRDYTVRVYS